MAARRAVGRTGNGTSAILAKIAAVNNGRPGFRRRARWRDPILALRLRIGDKATRFRALHEAPGAFVMPNPWDAGSARIPAGLGFRALALNGFMQV